MEPEACLITVIIIVQMKGVNHAANHHHQKKFQKQIRFPRQIPSKQLLNTTKHSYAIKPVPKPVPSHLRPIRLTIDTHTEKKVDTAAKHITIHPKICHFGPILVYSD